RGELAVGAEKHRLERALAVQLARRLAVRVEDERVRIRRLEAVLDEPGVERSEVGLLGDQDELRVLRRAALEREESRQLLRGAGRGAREEVHDEDVSRRADQVPRLSAPRRDEE